MMGLLAASALPAHFQPATILGSIIILGLTAAMVYLGARPLRDFILERERQYDLIFRRALLMNISPRSVTVVTALVIAVLGFMGYAVAKHVAAVLAAGAVGVFVPHALILHLRRRRLRRLEEQLVGAVQTIASGVRAGLNLVQSLTLVARDGPNPIRQEFAHLTREYEYGVSLDEAMANAANRIGSSDFRLLFSALHTHRERGGDLGETLDRIAESIREIQRLEKRVQTLTAQGRATARWLGIMPLVVGGILYVIDPDAVLKLFTEPAGHLIIAIIVVLTFLGFLWIRKVVSIDI